MCMSMICAHEHLIGNLADYGDFVEYQYDIRGKKVFIRPIRGQWFEGPEDAGEFGLLTLKEARSELER